jgi:hypothetical protein
MERRNDVSLRLIGMLILAASAAVERFASPHHPTALLQGFLDGVSITTLFGHVIRYRIGKLGQG